MKCVEGGGHVRLRINADQNRGQRGQSDCGYQCRAFTQSLDLDAAFLHIHRDHHIIVVIGRHYAIEYSDYYQPDVSLTQRFAEEEELADEAGQRRNSGQRQEEDSHCARKQRLAPREPAKVTNLITYFAAPLERNDYCERAEVGECISK